MSANPSHLEVVSPVVAGKAKAEQHFRGDTTGGKVIMPLQPAAKGFYAGTSSSMLLLLIRDIELGEQKMSTEKSSK